jgi:hypothetical protein
MFQEAGRAREREARQSRTITELLEGERRSDKAHAEAGVDPHKVFGPERVLFGNLRTRAPTSQRFSLR